MYRHEKNTSIYLLKGFACMGVVFIHIPFPGLPGQIIVKAMAFAVPVFCMASGYYAYGRDAATIKRRLIKIVKLFVIGFVLDFTCIALLAVKEHTFMEWLHKNFNWFSPIKAVCFCIIDFAIPLWYLIGMAETYILWLYVVKKRKEKSLLRLTPLLFLLQIALTAYCETRGLEIFWRFNFITRVLPWFLLGYYLHTDDSERLKRIDNWKLVLSAAAGCIIAVIPTLFDLPVKFNCVGYIPMATGLFVLALKNPSVSKCRQVQFIGEYLSVYIYLIHIVIFRLQGLLAETLFAVDIHGDIYLWLRPIITLILSILTAFLVYKITCLIRSRSSDF